MGVRKGELVGLKGKNIYPEIEDGLRRYSALQLGATCARSGGKGRKERGGIMEEGKVLTGNESRAALFGGGRKS